jgi:hypothetical protein
MIIPPTVTVEAAVCQCGDAPAYGKLDRKVVLLMGAVLCTGQQSNYPYTD